RLGARTTRVVPAAPLRVDERFVGLEDLPESRGGRAVARIDVRVEFPREPLVGALDLHGRRALLQAQNQVEVHEPRFPAAFGTARRPPPRALSVGGRLRWASLRRTIPTRLPRWGPRRLARAAGAPFQRFQPPVTVCPRLRLPRR